MLLISKMLTVLTSQVLLKLFQPQWLDFKPYKMLAELPCEVNNPDQIVEAPCDTNILMLFC